MPKAVQLKKSCRISKGKSIGHQRVRCSHQSGSALLDSTRGSCHTYGGVGGGASINCSALLSHTFITRCHWNSWVNSARHFYHAPETHYHWQESFHYFSGHMNSYYQVCFLFRIEHCWCCYCCLVEGSAASHRILRLQRQNMITISFANVPNPSGTKEYEYLDWCTATDCTIL